MKKYSPTPIRIPVKLVEGRWEFLYGGEVPLRDGTVGELLISKSAISDKQFFDSLQQRTEHKILEPGTSLLVALTILPSLRLDADLLDCLVSPNKVALSLEYFDVMRSPHTAFVEVKVGGPTLLQERKAVYEKGGVWLAVQGMQPKGIVLLSNLEWVVAGSSAGVSPAKRTLDARGASKLA
ncbi:MULTISPECIES: hypothetical protein [Paraburkholderia]|uniref:Uncharacterized protein n=1 Tax=Paraburkholderia podalyriae TaxID=1938811 RepID=A0ABR7Q2N6_9BURK|nr:hypothetical protein [Paraburkholderia podalyriae]MBC8752821.1 hypothetical protein [Paraburkholderia podalyriae]